MERCPRPMRPRTWLIREKVRSSVEKSGRLKPESAWTIPMVASFGRSSPLAIVWVPMMMSMSPDLTCS